MNKEEYIPNHIQHNHNLIRKVTQYLYLHLLFLSIILWLQQLVRVHKQRTALMAVISTILIYNMKTFLNHIRNAENVFPLSLVLLSILAPYEICPEDYAVSMVWRRTPSGELAFNRCPPNATGKQLTFIKDRLFIRLYSAQFQYRCNQACYLMGWVFCIPLVKEINICCHPPCEHYVGFGFKFLLFSGIRFAKKHSIIF